MRHLITLTLIIIASLVVCTVAFAMLAGSDVSSALLRNLAVSLPLALVAGVTDYLVLTLIGRQAVLKRHPAIGIAAGWLTTQAVGLALLWVVMRAMGSEFSAERILTFTVWNSIVVLTMELFAYHREVLSREAQLARSEREKATLKYQALKNQIRPHFLFNSLNVLSALTYQDADKANRFTKKLSAVYRYLLVTSDRTLVTLADELDFLRSYLYLTDMRFGRAVSVTIGIDADTQPTQWLIAPAALQMLVENALKHNIATQEQPLTIVISAQGGLLTVSNPLQRRPCPEPTTGTGLASIAKQYDALGLQVSVDKTHDNFTVTLPLVSSADFAM